MRGLHDIDEQRRAQERFDNGAFTRDVLAMLEQIVPSRYGYMADVYIRQWYDDIARWGWGPWWTQFATHHPDLARMVRNAVIDYALDCECRLYKEGE